MIDPRQVAITRVPQDGATAYAGRAVRDALRETARQLGWTSGAPGESAFARLVPSGARVLVKPNLVLHRNHGAWGIEPLFTHPLLIRAVVEELLLTAASQVIVGDAPLQECDFDALLRASGMDQWAPELAARDPRFHGPRDYRRTKTTFEGGLRVEREGLLPVDRFVLYDLQHDSLLEPISQAGEFRVTQYPPAELARTHAPGRHQYLVARDIIEADVVVNLPKLKTHKKAGITNALKNLIGINGNKEFLPHHRLGGSEGGGDCYPGDDPVKRALEFVYDQTNSTRSILARRIFRLGTRVLQRILHAKGDALGVEGSWSGNDTIWRTCLDLNRILLHGTVDGTVAAERQRQVVHVVDAIVAGHGDGPLRAEPLPLGLLLAGSNAAAVDLVGARLLGYVPGLIPIVAHAFDRFRWPLTDFAADEVRVSGALGDGDAAERVRATFGDTEMHWPAGWLRRGRTGPAPRPQPCADAGAPGSHPDRRLIAAVTAAWRATDDATKAPQHCPLRRLLPCPTYRDCSLRNDHPGGRRVHGRRVGAAPRGHRRRKVGGEGAVRIAGARGPDHHIVLPHHQPAEVLQRSLARTGGAGEQPVLSVGDDVVLEVHVGGGRLPIRPRRTG